jgi:hypothetical protein
MNFITLIRVADGTAGWSGKKADRRNFRIIPAIKSREEKATDEESA